MSFRFFIRRALVLLAGSVVAARLLAAPGGAGEGIEEMRRRHWAFQPLRRPRPPAVRDASWPQNAIDRFVLARLEARGLAPSGRADPHTLIRRIHFDLLGLPPTYQAVRSFVRDPSPDAVAAIVDELLGRREYGERWGRHWLDVARYADTKGYVDAGEPRYPFAYTYRDYVIRAFNDDVPFDRFVLEQLAADRLAPGDDRRALAALGFLTVGQRFNFFPHEIIDDRIDVVTRGLMGLTVTCSRCHDHKYDPITMEDYYGLHGVFASSREPSPDQFPLVVEPGRARSEDAEFLAQVAEKAGELDRRRRELHRQIQHEMRAWAGDYLRYIVELMPQHRTLAQPPLRTERGLLREVTAYGRGGVGRWRRYIEERGAGDPVFGFWNRVVRLKREEVATLAPGILVDLKSSGIIHPLVAEALEARPPANMVDVADVYGRLLEETEELWQETREKNPGAAGLDDAAREQLRQVLYGSDAPATMTIDESEDLYHLDEHSDVRKRHAEVERVFLAREDALPRAMVLFDRPEPVQTRVFIRGDPERRGQRVHRRFPRFLSHVRGEPFAIGSGRLELARAIVHPGNPLTPRVLVNRIWGWHFGRPLVSTPSDFGIRSSPPTHPALLDWLASRFIEEGWSIKKLHRTILLSSTWQQASADRPGCREVDPGNELLWRMNRRHLDFEAMRDSLLAVAGRLESGRPGRPIDVRPDDPSSTVRTVYCLLDRERLPAVFRVFDFPSPDISSPERSRTTVPQQALFLLNSPFVIAQAESLASRLEDVDAGDRSGRIRRLHRIVYARDPRPEEVRLAESFLRHRSSREDRASAGASASAWRYGFGAYDGATERLESFTPLPHFSGKHWQGGPKWPDPELHYLRLTATGGHVGIDHAHAAVRRWVAPRDGIITIRGRLEHGEEDCGDGIQAWVASSEPRQLGHWTVHRSGVETEIRDVPIEAGDTIDFIVDLRENHSCDLFDWAPVIVLEVEDDRAEPLRWDAAGDFGGAGSRRRPLTPWAEYAQALLESNEFLFVD